MIKIPNNYKNIYPCINTNGSEARIYANYDKNEAYKIYRRKFNYDEEKLNELQKISNPNCIIPQDILYKEDNSTAYIGYSMKYQQGKSLSSIQDIDVDLLISKYPDIINCLEEITSKRFLILDSNGNNIMFYDTYKIIDTWAFHKIKNQPQKAILKKNIENTNSILLSGLIDIFYKDTINQYLKSTNSKYIDLFNSLNKSSKTYISDIFSILVSETKETDLKKIKTKIIKTSEF